MQLLYLVLHMRCDTCLQDEYPSVSILHVCDLCAIIRFTCRDGEISGIRQPFVDERSLFLENCKAKILKIKINCPLPPFQS